MSASTNATLFSLGFDDAAKQRPVRTFEIYVLQRIYDLGRQRYVKMEEQIATLCRLRGESREKLLAHAISMAYHHQKVSEKPAKGVRGCLIRSAGEPFLRVYKHTIEERSAFAARMKAEGLPIDHDRAVWDEMFFHDDYRISHNDMDVTIDEEHASLFETIDGDHFIGVGAENPIRLSVGMNATHAFRHHIDHL